MTDRTSADHLEDILDAINKALLFTEDYAGYEDFAEDDRAVFAVIRALEVIRGSNEAITGQAAGQASRRSLGLNGRNAR